MQRYALVVSYDGGAFHGFQFQNSGMGVQNHLELALKTISGKDVTIVCAGRTDSGVHASGQVVHADLPASISPKAWIDGVNRHLPATVKVIDVIAVPDSFHARFSAVSRTYCYVIYQSKRPLVHLRDYAYHSYRELDVDRMQEASQLLLGERDFSSFRASGCQAKHAVRHLMQLDWHQEGKWVIATITANAFIYRMVRNLMGVLLPVGWGISSKEEVERILLQADRRHSGRTAPASALYLDHVGYNGYNTSENVSPWYSEFLGR